MRMRTWLLGLILVALLMGFMGVAISSSADYTASSASLRALWATDLAAGVSAHQLAPLQAELAATQAHTLAKVPTVAFNPFNARTEIASLRTRTNTIYLSDLILERNAAFSARTALLAALGPVSVVQTHAWRDEIASATTPADYAGLAAAWQLDALLVPLDRSLAAHQVTLGTLLAQAASLSLSSPDATALAADTTAYSNDDPATRYAVASTLLARFDPVTTSLQAQVNSELAVRAARAAAAAAAQAAAAQSAARTAAAQAAYNAPLYLSLNGYYTDCTGAALVAPGLTQDTCVSTSNYLLAHKWSTGRLFFALHVGSVLVFRGHTYTVYSVTQVSPQNWKLADQTAPLTLQTCWTDSGSIWLIIRAR